MNGDLIKKINALANFVQDILLPELENKNLQHFLNTENGKSVKEWIEVTKTMLTDLQMGSLSEYLQNHQQESESAEKKLEATGAPQETPAGEPQ